MAAPSENLWSLGHMNRRKPETLTQTKGFSLKRSSRVHRLQQRWMELKDREHRAQHHNQQLLLQFSEAQDTLRELQAHNANMKMISIEYERYLQENGPRWQQQLNQQTQKKSMETYLNDSPQKERKTSPQHGIPEGHCHDVLVSSLYPLVLSSWLTNSQSHSADHPPPLTSSLQPNLLHRHHQHSASNQNISRASDPHWSRIPSPLNGQQLYIEEPVPGLRLSQVVDENEEETSERRRRHLSQELDVQPVCLSGSHSSESDQDFSQSTRKREEERRSTQQTPSDGEKGGSEESSRSSPIIDSAATEQASETDASSGIVHRSIRTVRREGELTPTEKKSEEEETTTTRNNNQHSGCDSEESRKYEGTSGSLSEETEREKVKNLNVGEYSGHEGDKWGSMSEDESGKNSSKISDGTPAAGVCESSSSEEKDNEPTDQEEEKDEDGESNGKTENNSSEDDEVSSKNNTSDEDDDTGSEDEVIPNQLKSEDVERKKRSTSSGEEEDEESKEEERGDEEAGKDSEESIIISPQERRPKVIQLIPEEKSEAESSGEDSDGFSDEDIENLLAPQQPKKEETEWKSKEKPKDVCNIVQIFRVQDTLQTDQLTDSEEFDHFYD